MGSPSDRSTSIYAFSHVAQRMSAGLSANLSFEFFQHDFGLNDDRAVRGEHGLLQKESFLCGFDGTSNILHFLVHEILLPQCLAASLGEDVEM